MKIEIDGAPVPPTPVQWEAGKVYRHQGRTDYWLCVNARYSGGLMLVSLADGSAWDSDPLRKSPVDIAESWKEVKNVKVVVG